MPRCRAQFAAVPSSESETVRSFSDSKKPKNPVFSPWKSL